MKKLFCLIVVLALGGCTTTVGKTSDMYGNNAYRIKCTEMPSFDSSSQTCAAEIKKVCPHGYYLINQSAVLITKNITIRCAQNDSKSMSPKQMMGAGTLLGAFADKTISQSLDQEDMSYHQQTVVQTETGPLNQTLIWKNPDSGHSGSVTAIREIPQDSNGDLCREYKQTINTDGKSETAVGIACQHKDGTWSLENQ